MLIVISTNEHYVRYIWTDSNSKIITFRSNVLLNKVFGFREWRTSESLIRESKLPFDIRKACNDAKVNNPIVYSVTKAMYQQGDPSNALVITYIESKTGMPQEALLVNGHIGTIVPMR
jgi:hypothetical protein